MASGDKLVLFASELPFAAGGAANGGKLAGAWARAVPRLGKDARRTMGMVGGA